jgi:hypothetical protein
MDLPAEIDLLRKMEQKAVERRDKARKEAFAIRDDKARQGEFERLTVMARDWQTLVVQVSSMAVQLEAMKS